MPERVIIAAAQKTHAAFKVGERLWRRGGPLLPPAVKSLLFAAVLLYAQRSGFSAWSLFLLIAVAAVSYMQPVFKTFSFGTSFLLTTALSVLLTSRFTITLPVSMHAGLIGQILFSLAFGFLFFMLLGIKNVIFVRRQQWYTVLFIALVHGISLLFFTSLGAVHPWRDTILLALFMYLLLREYFATQEYATNRAQTVITLTLTLMLVETAWALSLLPLGFSKAASVLTLIGMMSASATSRYIRGTLTARFLRTNFVLLAVLVGIIFASVRWVI